MTLEEENLELKEEIESLEDKIIDMENTINKLKRDLIEYKSRRDAEYSAQLSYIPKVKKVTGGLGDWS